MNGYSGRAIGQSPQVDGRENCLVERPLDSTEIMDIRKLLKNKNVDLGTDAKRLSMAAVHELAALNLLRKIGKVLNLGGGEELATRFNVVGHPAFEKYGLEFCLSSIDAAMRAAGPSVVKGCLESSPC
ncbi:hypothetical protein JCGZ_23191 [Jatropha curcas]|uniref:Uncharacterized protein n=1 Tax=Jatropha curcas TaxID=180498 RepID=A0A067JKM1_JATCU|nr:hypothetical protein JCGZ_23191 [Jatropha curcas]